MAEEEVTIENTLMRYVSRTDKASLHKNDAATLARLLAFGETPSAPALDPRRRDCVTASDVAAICRESSYETTEEVLRKKMFHTSFPDNKFTLHGKKYEPVAIAKVAAGSVDGSKVKAVHYIKFVQAADVPWIGGTLDGILELEDGRVFVLEIKCPLSRKIVDGFVPFHYMSQIQTYMFITGLNACAFAQFAPAGLKGVRKPSPEILSITLVTRDPGYVPLRLPMLKAFHDRLVGWRHVGEQVLTSAVAVAQHAWRCKKRGSNDPAGRALRVACASVMFRICSRRRGAYEGKCSLPAPVEGDAEVVQVARELAECNLPPPAPHPYRDPGYGTQPEDVVCWVVVDPAEGPLRSKRPWRPASRCATYGAVPENPAECCLVRFEGEDDRGPTAPPTTTQTNRPPLYQQPGQKRRCTPYPTPYRGARPRNDPFLVPNDGEVKCFVSF